MPWVLSKMYRFEASHQLPLHDGKCARLHGHSWCMRVEVRAETLQLVGPQSGMVLDYGAISVAVQPLLDATLDHWHLNDTTGLANPTSEELARWVFDRLRHVLPGIHAVVIDETCTSRCRYEP